jgi:hypothetical protein
MKMGSMLGETCLRRFVELGSVSIVVRAVYHSGFPFRRRFCMRCVLFPVASATSLTHVRLCLVRFSSNVLYVVMSRALYRG